MTESSRTRSDSLEASDSQQDRKRPRLDPGHNDNIPSEEAVTDSGLPEASKDPDSSDTISAGGACSRNSSSSSPSNMEPSLNKPHSSKVTINTRTTANTAADALESSIDHYEAIQTSPKPTDPAGTPPEPASNPDMVAPPDTISIHSSPSRSPEIQIAVIEDIDQDPAETNWTPVTRLADSALLQEHANSNYVSKTFPYSQQTHPGFVHEILIEIGKLFFQGGERDGLILIQVKDWLANFLETHSQITERRVHEEKAFWDELPEVVNSLLRRLIDVPEGANATDLEDFFVSYGQLTIRFLELDLRLMNQCQALGTPEKLADLYCRPYLQTLSMVLQYRDVPFYTLLHASRGFNASDLVSTICDRLSGDSDEISPLLTALTAFVEQLGYILPGKPALTIAFVQALSIAYALARTGTERALLRASERMVPSPVVKRINRQVLFFCLKSDGVLQNAISKQSPWLTIENSPEILRNLQRMLHAISDQDAEIAAQLMTYVSDQLPETDHGDLPEIIAYAWKFKTLRKYITAGRMELRVYGMESMRIDLVEVWKCYAQYNPNSLSVPLVKFLVLFLRDSKMVQYIVGVDSHPQLISRSGNVVGFLVVTGTYCDDDSDIIWRTVKESQDPRTVSEVLNMLKQIFAMQSLPALMYLCQKLLELPMERFDSKMVDYAEVLLHHIREKALSHAQQQDDLEAVPFKLCVKLIRDAIASQTCSADQKCRLPSWAADNLVRLLAFNINVEDKRRLWEQCVDDIAQKTAFAAGSMRALQAWVEVRPDLEVPRLTRDFDFTRLLIEELVSCLGQAEAEASSISFLRIILPTRLGLLALVAQYAPDTMTEALTETLWSTVLASQTLDGNIRDMAWDVFSKVATCCMKPNSIIHRLMTDYLPRMDAENLNARLLYFAESSVLYEMRVDQPQQQGDQNVVSLPGIGRVWRFVMECPAGSVENEATNWIIKQYLDHDIVLRCPRRVVEATHLSLLERCLAEVFSAASKLKSFIDRTTSEEDEPMIVVASEEEVKMEELRFSRSLLFLRQFLMGVKCRPRYSPPLLSVEIRPPAKSFQDRGEEVTINYQAVPIPGRSPSSVQKKLVIGDLNTVDELAKYLSDLTGFTQFTGVSAGQKMSLIGNETTIKNSTISMGLLLVQKVPDTPEKQPGALSLDSFIMGHFNELYDLLELGDNLSKEVLAFLELFPPQPRITDLLRAKTASVAEVLPSSKPYKLLYGLNALRLCVEDEALGSAADEDFMIFSVCSIVSVLNRSDTTVVDGVLQLFISHALVDCLLLALRAKVSIATSQSYFDNTKGFADRLIGLAIEAARAHSIGGPRIPPHMLVRQPFAVLVESALHDAQIASEISSSDRLNSFLHQSLLDDIRAEVRKAIADVIFDLTGQPCNKLISHKSSDQKNAQMRFPAEKTEGLSTILWKFLVAILPRAYTHASTSQQLFEVSSAVLRIVGKTMASDELVACFQQWGHLLISYDHRETVGNPKEDYVVWGFANLLQEAYRSTQISQLNVATGQLAESIFDTFLYPTPTSKPVSATDQRIPLLKDSTREDLYGLVLSLTKEESDYDSIVSKLEGLVVKETFPGFAPHIQTERQALRSDVGYAGLRNLSNTCYLNSLFSQLFMNLRFREFIFAVDLSNPTNPGQSLVHELSRLFASMQNRWDKYVDTTEAVACIETYGNEQIDVSIQMDVDEFFILLFDRLEGQISNPEDRNTFRSVYGGQLVQQIKSRECDHISERLELFYAIQVEIKGKMTLEDSLRAYVEGEVMQGDNKYSCTSCNRHVDAIKRACLKDIPDHLIFNLKRFDFDITTMTRCKVNDEFRFPDSIDMAPYNVEYLSNPENPITPDMFELVGILVHSGTAESGHYYSYIRERPSSRFAFHSWVQFNDIDVSSFDSQRIGDCCYGGFDASSLHLSKSHNAYMLFYQRVSSIRLFEAVYDNHDTANPVRLPVDSALSADIDARNQETIRSYCLQDPSHARFIRLMLERMHWSTNRHCSEDHLTENKMVRHSLDYVQQISCRFKEMPEFDATCKLLQDNAQQCFKCASRIASFFAETDLALGDVRKESVLRCAVLRNPNTSVRRTFSTLLYDALRTMKKGSKDKSVDEEQVITRNVDYREVYTSCIRNLAEPWAEMHKFSRAWNDYFDLLSRLTGFGIWEAGVVLQSGFLEKIVEVIWADARHDPMELRSKYASYVNLREKGRVFGLTGLIASLSTILEFVDFGTRCTADGLRVPNRDGFYELSPYEAQLLRPHKMSQKQKLSLEWVRKVIMTKQNPNAVTKIVSNLLQENLLAQPLQVTLAHGLATETVGDAIAFLDPAITFCKSCTSLALVQLLVKEALNGVDSIGGTCGKEHLDFVIELADLENEAAGLTKQDFFTMVFRQLRSWAPTLLLFPDDIHYDVRNETLLYLQERIFHPLDEGDLDAGQHETMVRYARALAKSCVQHIQQNHLPRTGKQVARIEVGQSNHIGRVIQYTCEHFYGNGDAADDHFVTEAMATLEHLQAFTQEAAEAASEDWPENESVPASDSENGDFQEWNENA